MKISHSKWKIDKVIEIYQNNPFTEFTLENLHPIRFATGLGYSDIKNIILEYNTNTSAERPEMDDDIVRYSSEKKRVKDKEP